MVVLYCFVKLESPFIVKMTYLYVYAEGVCDAICTYIYTHAFMYFESQFAVYVGSTHFNYELELITSIVCILTDFLCTSCVFLSNIFQQSVRSPQISPPDEIRYKEIH